MNVPLAGLAVGEVAHLLVEGTAEGVRDGAVHLAFEQGRVEHGTRVVHGGQPLHAHLQGQRVDADSGHVGHVP